MAQVPNELADRLYAAHPEAFIAERDEAAADARGAGDRDLATAIGKLRKPTVAAWLVNLLALRRPDLVADLAELAGQLRAAQRDLRGDELRELSARRRAVVGALVEQAREVAVSELPELARAKLPLSDVESTLTAALADEEVAAQVRSGRLVRTVAYTGFGEVPRPKLRLVADGAAPTESADWDRSGQPPSAERSRAPGRQALDERDDARQRARARRAARADAERALAQARTDQKKAEAELDRAAAAEQDGARELAEVEAELAELRRRRATAEEELSRRKLARKTAERAVTAARRSAGEAQAVVEALAADADGSG